MSLRIKLRAVVALVRRWILKETSAERLARDKDIIRRELTIAQEKAAKLFAEGKAEVTKIAHAELTAIEAVIKNAERRISDLLKTETLTDDGQQKAEEVSVKISDQPPA